MGDDLTRPPIHSDSGKKRNRQKVDSSKSDEASPPKQSEPRSPRKQKLSSSENEESYEEESDSGNFDNSFGRTCSAELNKLGDCKKTLNAHSVNPMNTQSVIATYWPYALAMLGIAALGGYKYVSSNSGLTGKSYEPKISRDLGMFVAKELEKKFTNQAKLSFKTIKNSINRVIDSNYEPESPSSVILVSSKGAEDTVNCFANYFAKLVHNDDNFVNIDCINFRNQNSDKVKENIDDTIREYASHNKLNVVLVQNIEYLPGQAPYIFYRYCDDQNAPFKRTIIIMTVYGETSISKDFGYREVNIIAQKRLNESWTSIKPDQFDPLYNRIATYVTAINSESDLSHCKL